MWCSTLDKGRDQAAKGKEKKDPEVINLDDDDDDLNKRIKTEDSQKEASASSSNVSAMKKVSESSSSNKNEGNNGKNEGKVKDQQLVNAPSTSYSVSSSKTVQDPSVPSTSSPSSSKMQPPKASSVTQNNKAKQTITFDKANEVREKLLTLWRNGKKKEAKADCQKLLDHYRMSEFPPNVNLDDHEEDEYANRDVTEKFCILHLLKMSPFEPEENCWLLLASL